MSTPDGHPTDLSASDSSSCGAFRDAPIGLNSLIARQSPVILAVRSSSPALAVLLIAVLVVLPSIVLDGIVVSSIITPAGQL